MLKIVLPNRTSFEPGEEIEILIAWGLSELPKSLEARLVWSTIGRGTQDLEIAQVTPVFPEEASGQERLTITLPDAPYSCSGKLVSILWGLELVALPSEESTREEIVIAPQGREVMITAQTTGSAT